MKKLLIWDWHYRIFFDKDALNSVNEFISELANSEQRVYCDIRDFFLSFFSMSQLIDAVEARPSKMKELLNCAKQHSDILIKTPCLITDCLVKRISHLPLEYRKDMLDLLDYSRHVEFRPDTNTFYRRLYGDIYDGMLTLAFSCKAPAAITHGEKLFTITRTDIDSELQLLLGDTTLRKRFGRFDVTPFDLKVDIDTGYGEWWDRDLLCENMDKLVIHANDDSMYLNDLRYTLAHEIYPGHGHFYRTLAHNSHAFDHGAMSLIEGWATFVEWHSVQSDYSRQIREYDCALLTQCLSLNGNELANNVLSLRELLGFSHESNIRTALYTTQYIGFLESYYLGALWVELFLSESAIKPLDMLNNLSNQNVGDFFYSIREE